MYHPTTQVLTILELLQARGTLNGAKLATRLEVDRRTVRKYILMLQDLGILIEGNKPCAASIPTASSPTTTSGIWWAGVIYARIFGYFVWIASWLPGYS